MERTLGRKLKPGYVVDHLNGVRSDNTRENLREVTASLNGKNKPGCYVVSTYKTKIDIRKIKLNSASRIFIGEQPIKLECDQSESYSLSIYRLASDIGKNDRRYMSLDEILEVINKNVILLLNGFFTTYRDAAFLAKTSKGVLLDTETVRHFLGYVRDAYPGKFDIYILHLDITLGVLNSLDSIELLDPETKQELISSLKLDIRRFR